MNRNALVTAGVLLAVCIALLPAAGTTEGQAAAEGPVELTLWHELEPAVADTIAKELAALEPEIRVNVVRKEKSTEAMKLVGADPSGAPDLFWFAHDKVGLFAAMGILEPLESWVTAEELENFIPMTVEAGRYDGRMYQVPVTFETLLFMYNKALMPVPPATTDELLSLMKAKTTADSYVYVEQHSTAYYAAAWINAFGGYIINGKAEPGLSTKGAIDAVTYHAQFVPYMPKDGEWNTVTTLFTEGKAASTLNGPWLVPSVREKGIDLGFAPLPTVNAVGKPLAPFAGVQGLMVLKAGRHKDAAAKVVKFLMGRQLGESLSLATGAAPAHLAAYENPQISANELVSAMKTAGVSATPMPNIPEMDVMWTTTETALVNVNKKGLAAKDELEKAQAESLRLISDMK